MVVVEQAIELNDSYHRHQYLWICHYNKHKCKLDFAESTRDTPETKLLAKAFKQCAKEQFRGIQYFLISEDLANASQILLNTDDIIMDCNLSLAEAARKNMEWEAQQSAIFLTNLFKDEIFQRFYVAVSGGDESKLSEEKMKYHVQVWKLQRFLQCLDHLVSQSV